MLCERCGVAIDYEDNFCRNCGLPVGSSRLPVLRRAESLPVPWKDTRLLVLRGAAVVVAGAAFEVLRWGLARKLRSTSPTPAKDVAVRKVEPQLPSVFDEGLSGEEGDYQVFGTFFFKRVRLRR